MERNNNGTFAHGNKGGGRPKGKPNRATADIRDFFRDFLRENSQQIQDDYNTLKPYERIKFILEITKIVLPPLKSVEKDKTEKDIEILDFWS